MLGPRNKKRRDLQERGGTKNRKFMRAFAVIGQHASPDDPPPNGKESLKFSDASWLRNHKAMLRVSDSLFSLPMIILPKARNGCCGKTDISDGNEA
jgi:hypothetical protein